MASIVQANDRLISWNWTELLNSEESGYGELGMPRGCLDSY